jgi:AraC family transcriptional regulator
MTRQQENGLKELEALQKMLAFAPFATSDRRGWKGLQAARYRKNVANGEFSGSAIMHMLVLTIQPAEKMDLRYEGVKRDIPLHPGSISMVPAGSSVRWHRQGSIDTLFIYLEPSQVARIATESFGFDPTRTVVPPVVGLDLPELRSTMLAVDAELKSGGAGGPLMAESLATMLSVQVIRHTTGARRLPVSADGVLPRRKLRTVIEYIMENLEGSLMLERMAAVVHISPYQFARQFKASTGLPPHQYVIRRRVERAQHLLREDCELGLVEVALRVGFSDQSQFCFHFKRVVGVTPREFRISAGTR